MAETLEFSAESRYQRNSFKQYATLGLVATSISVAGLFVDDTGLERAVAAIPPHCIEEVQQQIKTEGSEDAYLADQHLGERRSADKTVLDRINENGFFSHFAEITPHFFEMMQLPHTQQVSLAQTEMVVNFYNNAESNLVSETFEAALMLPLEDSDWMSEPLSQHKIECHRKSLIDDKRHSGREVNVRLFEDASVESTTGFVLPPIKLIPGLSNPTLFILTADANEISFSFLAHELAHVTEVIEGNRYITRIKQTENWANEIEQVSTDGLVDAGVFSE